MQQIHSTKINNERVKPIRLMKRDTRPVRGANLFPEVYSNIFMCARKKSGKTLTIAKCLRRCAGPTTKIMVFCSTINKDSTWLAIRAWAQQKNLPFIGYTSIIDDDGNNLLKDLITSMQKPEGEKEHSLFDEEEEEEEEVPCYQSPEWIFVLDDLSDELRKPIIATFLKKNRHFRAKIIISSQYMNDLMPAACKQLDYVLLFKGQAQDKIEKICKDVDSHVSKEVFWDLYKFATKEPYSFLYVDVRGCTFRRNFDTLLSIE